MAVDPISYETLIECLDALRELRRHFPHASTAVTLPLPEDEQKLNVIKEEQKTGQEEHGEAS